MNGTNPQFMMRQTVQEYCTPRNISHEYFLESIPQGDSNKIHNKYSVSIHVQDKVSFTNYQTASCWDSIEQQVLFTKS